MIPLGSKLLRGIKLLLLYLSLLETMLESGPGKVKAYFFVIRLIGYQIPRSAAVVILLHFLRKIIKTD